MGIMCEREWILDQHTAIRGQRTTNDQRCGGIRVIRKPLSK